MVKEYGDPNLSIKRDEPGRLKNFRARHNCDSLTTSHGGKSGRLWWQAGDRGCQDLKEEHLPGQATTSHGGALHAALDHLESFKSLNQPADVRQKGSSDTFVVAKKDLKRAKDIVDDYFK